MSNEPIATAYLRYVLKEMGISATELAKRSGLASTTLTRPLNDPGHKFSLTTKTIQRIAEVSGISPGPFFSASDTAALNLASVFDDKVYDQAKWGSHGDSSDSTLVVGEVAPGVWREPEITSIEDFAPLLIRSANYDPKDCFGLVVRGRAIERIAEDGDILFCVHSSATKRKPKSGELVIVERKSPDGRMVEVSARVLRDGRHGPELRFASRDSRFANIISIGSEPADGLKIIGEVLYVIRPPIER